MAGKPELTNVFAWSASRAKTLDACARQYFNTHYGSWNGWRAPADSPPAQLYLLKKLDSRFAWSGHVAHALIARAAKALLNGGKPAAYTSEELVIEKAHETMREDFKVSVRRARARAAATNLRTLNGQKFYGLLEHELGIFVSDDEWRAVWARTESQLRWWFRSEWPETIRSLPPDAVLLTDEGNFDANRFSFDDTHVLSSPDLAFMGPNGDAFAVDWKGGRPDHSHLQQVTGYGEQLHERFGVPHEKTQLAIVYLGRGEVVQQLDDARAADWRERTRASISNMRSFLADPAKNKPKPVEAFPMTSDRSKCRFCPYQKRCDRFDGRDAGEAPASAPGPVERLVQALAR